MAKYFHADVLDGGLNVIKTAANEMWLLSAYADADNYATVTAAKLAGVAMASGDYTLSGADNAPRVLTSATKNATAAASGNAAAIAFVSTSTSKVLAVTEETSGQAVASGNTVNFPAIAFTSNQPT